MNYDKSQAETLVIKVKRAQSRAPWLVDQGRLALQLLLKQNLEGEAKLG